MLLIISYVILILLKGSWIRNPDDGDRVSLWNLGWFEQLDVSISLRRFLLKFHLLFLVLL